MSGVNRRASSRALAALIASLALLSTLTWSAWLAAPPASAQLLLPPAGKVFTGLTGGSSQVFQAQVGKHPAVDGVFVTWGRSLESAFGQAHANQARLMLHISTAQGYGAPEQITPRGIAQGGGDAYLLSLDQAIQQSGHPVYIRLLPEMDQANNAYCAFNPDGSSRGAAHSTASFRSAWRRVVLVLRGGPLTTIDSRLQALGMAPVRGIARSGTLPQLPVAFLWVPQTAGTPDTATNSPRAYYPGDGYVDWVGTDFYSLYPNFSGLEQFYSEYPRKPFAFGEWALWNGDDAGWVAQLFAFINTHRRVQMLLYNQGESASGPFRLSRYPNARRAIHRLYASPRFLAYTPEWEH